ncbi:MAG TPA: cytochrome C [Xanthobacteraceae bacterium]|jgi:mono/diheme cytochrome c family protein
MSRKHLLVLIAIALPAWVGGASSQEIGRRAEGLASAQHLCSECHAVLRGQAQSPNRAAPPFQAIASTPGMTEMALSAALSTSHRTMPNVLLAPDQRADIIAYILSLR